MLDNINVCGVVYDVIWMSAAILDEGREHWAVLNAETRGLSMFDGLSEHDTKHLLMHEMAHEVFNCCGIDIEEKYLKLFIRLLFDALDRNRIFTKNVK